MIVKINKDYNKECTSNFDYDSLLDVIQDKNFVKKISNEE
jgi:hypothetical protein